MFAYVSIRQQAYVADDMETSRSYTEMSLDYSAESCSDNTRWLSRQSWFVGNSVAWHFQSHILLKQPHTRFTGAYVTSQSELRLLYIHSHSLSFYPHSKRIFLLLISHMVQMQK